MGLGARGRRDDERGRTVVDRGSVRRRDGTIRFKGRLELRDLLVTDFPRPFVLDHRDHAPLGPGNLHRNDFRGEPPRLLRRLGALRGRLRRSLGADGVYRFSLPA